MCIRDRRGAQVFLGGQDGWATVEQNAAALKKRVEEILVQTGSSKIHLIAHSKGGLDARYLVSSLGMAPYVASVNLIAVPNLSLIHIWRCDFGGSYTGCQ